MLMHASGGAEVENALEKEPLQGIDARRPLQIQAHLTRRWRCKKPLEAIAVEALEALL